MVSSDGYLYEHSAIAAWMAEHAGGGRGGGEGGDGRLGGLAADTGQGPGPAGKGGPGGAWGGRSGAVPPPPSPVTGAPLECWLVPVLPLRAAVHDWAAMHGVPL